MFSYLNKRVPVGHLISTLQYQITTLANIVLTGKLAIVILRTKLTINFGQKVVPHREKIKILT